MDTETDRLARQVAEAADAWLRDPLDTRVYERLVRSTLDWRTRAQSPVGASASAVSTPPDEPTASTDDDPTADLDAVPVERRPQRLDLLLGGFADELRARTAVTPVDPTQQP